MNRAVHLAVTNTLGGSGVLPSRTRLRVYRAAGLDVGDETTILSEVTIVGQQLRIGANCFINRRCLLDAGDDPDAGITLADDVFLSFSVSLLTSTHQIGASHRRAGTVIRKPVRVGRGAWLGAHSTVLPGVAIGAGCIIGSGAVVTRDTEPDGVYAGVPATRRRDLPREG